MLNKIPLRLRLTLLCSLLLAICCIGLTIILNFSANRMANIIEATPLTPAKSVEDVIDMENAVQMVPTLPSETSYAARKSFLQDSILYMIILVAIGAVLTYYLSGKALKPLQELSSQMKNLTVHNLSEDLEIPKSKDEVADLTYSFNEMSNKLDEAFSMQKRFSESAAHELRTPLSTNLLHRAFFNLVENAIKYNYENGSVNIEVSCVNDQTLVTIEDTGIGIPEEMRTLIFEPFFRVDKSRSRQMGGAGLGLTMVKNIIDKHGGQIRVLENQSGGSSFLVTLCARD